MHVNEICSLAACRRQLGTERYLNTVQVETDNLQVWNNSSSLKFNTFFKIMLLVSSRRISAVVWGFTQEIHYHVSAGVWGGDREGERTGSFIHLQELL